MQLMQTNPKMHNYSPVPIYDCHAHLLYSKPIDESVDDVKKAMHHFNLNKIMILSVPNLDDTENCKAFYCKEKLSGKVFASAGIHHYFDERDTSDYYLNEIKKYHAMGCDGIKMLEGKMELHRRLKTGYLDSDVFDKFYAYAQENSIPILMHLGDPLSCWDMSQISQYALDSGWACTEDDPTREELREEVLNVLKKFPRLHLIMAHFNFMADELERVSELFDIYENLCYDLTPGGEMFVKFSEIPEKAKEFFIKYQDRLLFGTDLYNFAPEDMRIENEVTGVRLNQLRAFLEKTEPFISPILSEAPIIPLGLDENILDKIYRTNFTRIYGQMPRKVNYSLVAEECRRVLSERELDKTMADNVKVILDFFLKTCD